jgi:hypothetical protein
MKPKTLQNLPPVILALGLAILMPGPAGAQNYNVGSSGITAYVINGTNNPTLVLERGVTYVFNVNSFGHPFYIKTIPNSTGTGNQYTSGVTGNGVQFGTLTFAVPTNAPHPLYYHCSEHIGMGGTLVITNPPAPPTVQIVYINVANNVVLHSTGASGWLAIPEFSSNLLSSNWATVPGYSNTLTNGTNITTFNRLEELCGPNVILRVRNQKN